MRGIVLNLVMIVLSIVSLAQEKDGWKKYTTGVLSDLDNVSNNIFLIEASREMLQNDFRDYLILRIIDDQHVVVKGKPNNNSKAWNVNNNWKLNLIETGSETRFYIVTTPSFDRSLLSDFDIVKIHESSNTFLIESRYQAIEKILLTDPNVVHITNKIFTPKTESRVIDLNLNPNRINKIHHTYPDLNGSTETISIQENRFNNEDIDLLNRSVVTGLESEEVDNHATEMATIVAGAGNSFITGKGVASGATITSSSFIDAMPDADADYTDFGINTQNHSYGIIRVNEYGVEARAFDQSAFQNKNLLHVFSSGNEGLEVSTDGEYEGIEGYANLTGNIKMTKNSLVVGSVDTVGSIPDFVSRGPAYDGRVKPEVVAYSVVGSSNSAALVSGVASLLQQQYREDNATDMPSALVKALLINSAEDVGPAGLDFISGYGNVNAWRSLANLRNYQFYQGSVNNGNVDSFTLNLPANALNLKVTICWTDPPANVNDFTALVNNLDLRLVNGPTTTLPWVLDSNPDVSDLAKEAVRGVDALNNIEQVTIANPEPTYTVEIEGSAVSGSQDFFIVWQYDTVDDFEWDYPTGSDNMPYNGETGSYFRWTTTKSGSGVLSYTINDVEWTTLDGNIAVERGYWRWNNPPNIQDEVKAQIQINGESFETEWFSVSEPPTTGVGFNCGDSLMLKWDHIANAEDYTIKSLGVETLELFATTADTFLVVQNISGLASRFFSIQPNLPGGKGLLPSPSFDYTLQGVGCYVFSFFQTVALDTGIYLNLRLGTTYGIDRIELARNNFSTFDVIETQSNLDKLSITFLDDSPNQGYNEHRATIYFQNGEQITLTAGSSYYLTEEPLRIFPNPIHAEEPFSIITKEFEDKTPLLELVDDRGTLVHKQEVQGMQDVIPTGGLRSGIYFYRLHADGAVYTGRIQIR